MKRVRKIAFINNKIMEILKEAGGEMDIVRLSLLLGFAYHYFRYYVLPEVMAINKCLAIDGTYLILKKEC